MSPAGSLPWSAMLELMWADPASPVASTPVPHGACGTPLLVPAAGCQSDPFFQPLPMFLTRSGFLPCSALCIQFTVMLSLSCSVLLLPKLFPFPASPLEPLSSLPIFPLVQILLAQVFLFNPINAFFYMCLLMPKCWLRRREIETQGDNKRKVKWSKLKLAKP